MQTVPIHLLYTLAKNRGSFKALRPITFAFGRWRITSLSWYRLAQGSARKLYSAHLVTMPVLTAGLYLFDEGYAVDLMQR